MKKLFIISGVIFLLLLVFFGIYRFAFYTPTPGSSAPSTTTQEPTPTTENPTAFQDGQITALTTERVIAPVLTTGEARIRYVNQATGNIEEVDLQGTNKTILFENTFTDIGHVSWSEDRTRVLIQGKTDQSYFLYDLTNQTKAPFKANVDFARWTTVGNRILYKEFNPETTARTLNISDASGINWKKLADLPWRRADFTQVPKTAFIAFWNAPTAHEETQLLRVGAVGESTSETIFSGRFGTDYRFAPNGQEILLSVTDTQSGTQTTLARTNKDGGEYQNLAIPTFVSKAAWSTDSSTIYYALPAGIPDGSVLPNDYMDKKFFTTDTFWRVDLATGKKERIVALENLAMEFDATNLFAPQAGKVLFFTNRRDGRIYRIDL